MIVIVIASDSEVIASDASESDSDSESKSDESDESDLYWQVRLSIEATC